jgi:cysteinyl-tRNA synthetase
LARVAVLRRGAAILRELSLTLGLFRAPRRPAQAAGDEMVGKLLDLLVEVRGEARREKNFAMADRIRNALAELGVTLEDRPGGTEWTIAK